MSEPKLYSKVPPTKLRHKNEKFRKAVNDPFWVWVADTFFGKMLQGNFYSLRYTGEQNVEKRNKNYASILYAPHGNWWDGVTGYNIIRRIFKQKVRMMIEELNRFPLLTKAGAYVVNKKSSQTAMKALIYTIEQLQDKDIALWIFPQGIIMPPNYRPIEFQTGLSYIAQNCAKKYGGVNLFPIATNFTFLREDLPEVIVDIGEPIIVEDPNLNRKEHSIFLQQNMETLLDNQLHKITCGELEDYKVLFKKDLPWYRKFEKYLKHVETEFIDK